MNTIVLSSMVATAWAFGGSGAAAGFDCDALSTKANDAKVLTSEEQTFYTANCIVIPGTGYGCDNQCAFGDVNIVLEATMREHKVAGSGGMGIDGKDEDFKLRVRTFETGNDYIGCDLGGGDGKDGILGPCITMLPGQTVNIKLVNKMDNGMKLMNQHGASLASYQHYAEANNGVGGFTGTPSNMSTIQEQVSAGGPFVMQNIPGYDYTYDTVNLHLHGMEVVPHLFYPLGTSNPKADWITTKPQSELTEDEADNVCFCYSFTVPEQQEQGLYFYHIHRHGSDAIQGWSGMVGLLQVGDSSTKGSPSNALDEYFGKDGYDTQQVTTLELLFTTNNSFVEDDGTTVYLEPDFVPSVMGPDPIAPLYRMISTNGVYQPTYAATAGRPLYVPFLCGQVTTGTVVYFVDEQDTPVSFHLFGSDGISYESAQKRTMLALATANREEFIVSFPKAGRYRLMGGLINGYPNPWVGVGLTSPIGHPGKKDFPIAFFEVAAAAITQASPSMDGFAPRNGVPQAVIVASDIVKGVNVSFDTGLSLAEYIVPQFSINGKLYNVYDSERKVSQGQGQQWNIFSPNGWHPFHIHVNPFLVKEVSIDMGACDGMAMGMKVGSLCSTSYLISLCQLKGTEHDAFPDVLWKDTFFLPQFSTVTTWQHFHDEADGGEGAGLLNGKTVFHCHFLDHEDQGMMQNFIIEKTKAD